MKRGQVQINELRIRASGLSRDEGRRLGETVARLINAQITSIRAGRIPSAHLKISANRGDSTERIAGEIIASMRNRLR